MKVEDCYQLGHVIKTHGLKGEVQIKLDVDDPMAYQDLESVFVEQNGILIPFFLEYLDVKAQRSIAKFEDIDDLQHSESLIGQSLFLPLDALPVLPEGEYYFHQLVGMDVFQDDNLLGTISQVYEIPPQNLAALDHKGVEVMIPIHDEFFAKVSVLNNRVDVTLPEGLLELYLDETNED